MAADRASIPCLGIASINMIVLAVEGGLAIYALHRAVDMRTAPQPAQITTLENESWQAQRDGFFSINLPHVGSSGGGRPERS